MRAFTITLIIAICLAVCTDAFLFSKKKKDACDPNPCKHKGVCSLDPHDKMKFDCECGDEYHGDVCEKKSGCHKNMFGKDPCGKHGTCSNDAENPSKFHCKCEPNYVGPECDIEDKCLTKNPCKKGSVCTLDEKFKPVCECQNGYTGKGCDKRNCQITKFKSKYINGKEDVYVDKAIESKFEKMEELAKLCGVTLDVTQSFTKLVNPNSLPKNNHAMFFIGRGLRFEIMDSKHKNVICDTKCLGKIPIADKNAKCFIDGLDAIRWSYSSFVPGVVHDGSHINNFGEYSKMKEVHQVGCQQDKHFPVAKGKEHLVVDNSKNGRTCPKGLAGPDCDKDDLCVKKNPCNKGSECTLDAKLKPVCHCPNGFSGTKCNKRNCTITAFKGKQFGGSFFSKTKVYVSEDQEENFKHLDDLAKLCKVNFHLKSAFKKNNDPNYKIDRNAPLYSGHGIVVELNDEKDKLLCNELCLSKSPQPLPAAKCLLDGLDAIGFVHNPKNAGLIFHKSLLENNNDQYKKLKEFKQVGCANEKWYKKL